MKLKDHGDGLLSWACRGCGTVHTIPTQGDPPVWGYNGNPEAPTFTPSIRASGRALELDAEGWWSGEWKRDANGETIPSVCHSFITDGQVQYLSDSTHHLAGQTVPLEDIPERWA